MHSSLTNAKEGNPGSLFVIVAPSGAGKTSLVRALLERDPSIGLSVSFTTRPPRLGEIDGVHYHFIDERSFIQKREAGEFLEWAQVHGNFYATSRAWIEDTIRGGRDLILEIDCQGADNIRHLFPESVGIFIAPPSLTELERRLRARAQDSDAVIAARMSAARSELAQAHKFEYVIINQDFATAVEQLNAIVRASRLRFGRQWARHSGVFKSLGVGSASAPPTYPDPHHR
jgi:guanylate kinase